MSSLTTKCRVYYVAVLYSKDDELLDWYECETMEEAIGEAKEMIEHHIDCCYEYCHAKIECKVEPLYE